MGQPGQPISATPGDLSIAAAERDTGLSKDTLRVWERRYGFPQPGRDAFGERVYPGAQIDRLRTIRRLMDAGHRPGKLIRLDEDQLDRLAEVVAVAAAEPCAKAAADVEPYLELIRTHQVQALRSGLSQVALRIGLEAFVTEICAPLTGRVGEAWAQGRLDIVEEHLYTESMQVVLRNAISAIPASQRQPRVMLTTLPGEGHGLGLLMVEALLALEACQCISLGTQTPAWDIARAAHSQSIDIVALSFSASLGAQRVHGGLAELRAGLPPPTEIWAGGRSAALRKRVPAGVVVMASLAQIAPAVQAWRAARDAP